MTKKKFLLITTVPISLIFFKGQIRFLKTKFDVEVISSSGENLELTCKNEQVKGHVIEMKREIALFYDLISLFKLIKKLNQLKPDIIHGSTPKAGLLSMIAAWITRTPKRIYYIHGLRYQGAKGVKKTILMKIEKISCLFATDIFAVSNGVKKNLVSDKITSKKINIIGNGSVNGIDANYFSKNNPEIKDLKNKYQIKNTHFVYGFVGRLVKDKGINELINAFTNINKKNKNTKLILVGPYEDKLDPLNLKIKNRIKNNNSIITVGFQTDIRPFLKMMNLFVFPSYREGFGISLMEAAAMDLPSIASDIIGCNEIVKHNYNGLLIKPKSTADLEKAMLLLLNSKDKYIKMSSVTRAFIIDKYEQKKLWNNTLKAYLKVSIK